MKLYIKSSQNKTSIKNKNEKNEDSYAYEEHKSKTKMNKNIYVYKQIMNQQLTHWWEAKVISN